MKILILGAGGMLGHKLFHVLKKEWAEVYGSVRKSAQHYKRFSLFSADHLIDGLDVTSTTRLIQILDIVKPNVVCNCIDHFSSEVVVDMKQPGIIECASD